MKRILFAMLVFSLCSCMLVAEDLQQTNQKEELTEALFQTMNQWLSDDVMSDNRPSSYDRLESWRKAHKLEKEDMTNIFVKTIQDYYSELEKKSENKKLKKWHHIAINKLAYYPLPQKQFMELIERALEMEPDSSVVVSFVFGYMKAYPDWIFEEKPMIEIMHKCNSNSFKLNRLYGDLLTQIEKEKNEIRKKKLLDKAFEWALQDDMLEIFHFLDRILLDRYEKGYASNPGRKLQLKKELEMYEKKECYDWVYRRTKYALEHFGEGDKALETLFKMDTDPKLQDGEWERAQREKRLKEGFEEAEKQGIDLSTVLSPELYNKYKSLKTSDKK